MTLEWLVAAIVCAVLLIAGMRLVPAHRHVAGSVLFRAAIFALLWWILTEGHAGFWPLGVAGVALATLLSVQLIPPAQNRFSLARLPHFFLFFLWSAFKGGTQVAAMALRPRLDLHPAILELELRLPDEGARMFLATTLSLLPGTLSCALEGRRLSLHILDDRGPIEAEVRAAEAQVRALFGSTP